MKDSLKKRAQERSRAASAAPIDSARGFSMQRGAACVSTRLMKRDYYSLDGAAPVRNRAHSTSEDLPVNPGNVLVQLMVQLGMRDGDEFEVCVTPTGRRPHGDRRFLFPHGRPETDDEVLARIEADGPFRGSTGVRYLGSTDDGQQFTEGEVTNGNKE